MIAPSAAAWLESRIDGRGQARADVASHPQLQARDRWADYGSPAGPLRMLKHPMNIRDLPHRTDAVPAIGEHTEEVLKEIGLA